MNDHFLFVKVRRLTSRTNLMRRNIIIDQISLVNSGKFAVYRLFNKTSIFGKTIGMVFNRPAA